MCPYSDVSLLYLYIILLFISFLEPVDIFSDDPVSSSGQPPPPRLPALDEVTWEYRWEDKEDADIHGPYSSTQMSEWKENGYS